MRYHYRFPLCTLAVMLFVCASATAAEKEPRPMSNADFVHELAIADMAEVELGKLAMDRSKSQDVRSFAQRMIDDHGKNGADLKNLATRKNLKVPERLDIKHRARIDMLKAKSAASFDAAYSDYMAKDHEKDVGMLQKASTGSGLDSDLQAFARQTLTTVQEHERLARNLVASHPTGKSESREAEKERTRER